MVDAFEYHSLHSQRGKASETLDRLFRGPDNPRGGQVLKVGGRVGVASALQSRGAYRSILELGLVASRVRGWEVVRDPGSAIRLVLGPDSAPVGFDERAGDREAETGAG